MSRSKPTQPYDHAILQRSSEFRHSRKYKHLTERTPERNIAHVRCAVKGCGIYLREAINARRIVCPRTKLAVHCSQGCVQCIHACLHDERPGDTLDDGIAIRFGFVCNAWVFNYRGATPIFLNILVCSCSVRGTTKYV